jgi:hypothetical protein
MTWINLGARLGVAAFAAALAIQPAAAEPASATHGVRIAAIRMQLVYDAGGLSRDITPPATFALWNTGAGEGDAAGPAQEALVSVVLAGQGMENLHGAPLRITVRSHGRVLASHTYDDVFMTGPRVVKTVLVRNIACAGHVTIEATLGAQRRATAVNFDCGE